MIVTPNVAGRSIPVTPSGRKKMLTVGADTDGKPQIEINSSSLAILLECPRKAQYVLHRGLRRRLEDAATLYGSAIHAALEVFYSSKREERVLPSEFERKMEDMAFYDGEPDELVLRAARAFVQKAEALRQLEASNKRSIPTGLWTLTHYFKTYIDDPYEVLHDADGPVTERSVRFVLAELPDLRIYYFGQIDVVLQNRNTGSVLVTDHKTSSIVGNDFYNRLKPNHQYTGYLLGAKKCLGIETDSFLVNCIQVKPKPVTSRGQPPHFPRQVTVRSAQDYEEFEKTVASVVHSYIMWQKQDFFPMGHVNACGMYGGCQFLQVCAVNDPVRESVIQANFTEGTEDGETK